MRGALARPLLVLTIISPLAAQTIDCYVMGSRTHETASGFERQGLGWSYGNKPTFVLTTRNLPRIRETVEFYSGDLAQFVNERLRRFTFLREARPRRAPPFGGRQGLQKRRSGTSVRRATAWRGVTVCGDLGLA